MAIYGYLMVTRAIDPVALERARMAQVSNGRGAGPAAAPPTGSSTSRCRSWPPGSPTATPARCSAIRLGYDVMGRVAADENLHHLFYRDLATAAFELDPSAPWCMAIEREVTRLRDAGHRHPGLRPPRRRHRPAGIYDLGIHHSQILVPVVLHQWRVAELEGLTPEAEASRERLLDHIERMGRIAVRLQDRRQNGEAAGD